MKKRFIKNYYSVLNFIGMILMLSTGLLIALIASSFNSIIVIISLSLEIPFVITFYILYKHVLSIVEISSHSISVSLFSKKVASFNWQEFDKITFNYRPMYAPVVKFWKHANLAPVLTFDLTRKSLSALKEIDEVNPEIKKSLERVRLTKLGHFRIND